MKNNGYEMLQPLNLPEYPCKIRRQDDQVSIFDVIRKKYVALTPEEWVRQNFLNYLMNSLGYPSSLIRVEAAIRLNGMAKRCDAVVYNRRAEPLMILEFKAQHIPLNQDVFDQAARYNLRIGVSYLVLSNGMEHYCCKTNPDAGGYKFLEAVPEYFDLG